MHNFRSALFLILLALVPSSTTYAQSTVGDTAADATTSDVSPVSSPHRYRELSFYTAQTFYNPQIMSDFGGEHLFFTGVRLTSRLFTTPHLLISGNLDLKPLAIYSRNVPNCKPNGTVNCWKIGDTYGGGGSVGFQFVLRNSWRWQPFFDADGGLIAFTHDVPFPNTRRVNLTPQLWSRCPNPSPGEQCHTRRSLGIPFLQCEQCCLPLESRFRWPHALRRLHPQSQPSPFALVI